MATFTAIGPALAIDGPLPVAPPYRLLALPGVVQEGEGRWENGVNVWGYPEAFPSTWDPCDTGTFRVKEDDSDTSIPRFDPFVAYLPITCSSISVGGDPEAFAERAREVLRATVSGAVEKVLAQSFSGFTNPYFGDSNLTQLGTDGLPAQTGLSYLENAIGATGRKGMIHASPAVVSAWNYIDLESPEQAGSTDYLSTTNGTPVCSCDGVIGTDPVGKTGSTPSSGLEWAFATGPVEVYMGPDNLLPDLIAQALSRDDNVITYRAEVAVLPYWDTALQAGVLIDWTCGVPPCS